MTSTTVHVDAACVALKSSDKIPIEALWSYFMKYTGHDLKAAIFLGKTENYINVANELHMCFCANFGWGDGFRGSTPSALGGDVKLETWQRRDHKPALTASSAAQRMTPVLS
ncbi:hypothetical protein B0H13DRAFT_2303383 [Mycena leptocephala]|nr:hypothetical protein B0H13DRAFT_2303383 [Mycena leptocephala]